MGIVNKILAFSFSAFQLFSVAVMAQPSNPPPAIKLGWNPSPDPTPANVAGYWIWQGPSSSNYVRSVYVPGRLTTNVTLTNLSRGSTYFWNITVQGTNAAAGLESDFDGQATTNVPAPPLGATGLKIVEGT